jgi:hypothetical protein
MNEINQSLFYNAFFLNSEPKTDRLADRVGLWRLDACTRDCSSARGSLTRNGNASIETARISATACVADEHEYADAVNAAREARAATGGGSRDASTASAKASRAGA